MKVLRWTAVGVGALLLAAGAALAWILSSQSGAVWLVARVEQALGGKLAIATVQGSVAGPLTVRNVRYADPKAGTSVRIGRATVDVELRKLLTGTVHVREAAAEDLIVRLGTPAEPPPDSPPASLDPPIDLALDRLTLTRARIDRNGARLATVKHARLAGRWSDAGLAIRVLDVEADEGTVQFEGVVDERLEKYIGQGSGQFRWRLGERTYAAELTATSDTRVAKVDVRMTEPFAGRLEASMQQQSPLPWRFELDVPRFDPRKRLAPDTAVENLGASLRGRGDRDDAEIRGNLLVNGERVRVDPLRVVFSSERVEIKTLTLRSVDHSVTVHASGDVRFDAKPFVADVTVRWPDILLPPEWVGQPLASRGTLTVKGNPHRFEARAELAIGPPKRLSDVELALNGSAQSLIIERLNVIQQRGRLRAHGELQLRPALRWQLDADATHFDPGELFVAWPGDLGFALSTEGRLTEQGPQGSLALTRFGGTLRHRPVSGEADLALTPNKVVSGTLRLASGRSSIRVQGKAGTELDLAARLDVESLDDWVPDARGTLIGRFEMTGRWPGVQVNGSARGTGLALNDSTVRIVRANVELADFENPRGTLTLSARGVRSGGFEFGEIGIHADGSAADHRVRLRARGTPLSAEVNARGMRKGNGWAGTVGELAIKAEDVPQLALRTPVNVAVDGRQFSVSESCFAGEDVSFCGAAMGDAQGRVQGRYSIENLPLALVRAVAAPEWPLALGGTIQGRGEIARNADGTFVGKAELLSGSGYVAQREMTEEPLLTYENLRLDAQLSGAAARATLAGALGGGGTLDAEVAVRGLLQASPTLTGRAHVVLGTLRAIEIFTPQLADVKGRAEARAFFDGTLESLGLTGSVQVREFAAEVPALGLKLRGGDFEASLQPAGGARFAGSITSADGEVTIDGAIDATGALKARIKGNQVLAADIPAGRIVIDPELTVTRTPERVSLVGTVAIPSAAIDLTKLPQGRGQRASPDVVVVDEPAEEKERDQFPLYTDITIVVGPDVELTGFGLEATIDGRLAVRETPGEEPLAAGEVSLQGTYKAYGQDLTIERGRLLYAGTALGNPQLDIVAVRKVSEVTAQLRVTGTAQRPELAVSADPAMSQTEALSYLVRGKPVNQLTTEDNDVMQTAARSLGGAAGNLLAKSLGRRLGIDEIGIEQSTEIGGSVFTIGEYLSPRLYLSYGWGLFEPGEIVTLRYEISEEWALQASQGPQEQRAGVEYRIER